MCDDLEKRYRQYAATMQDVGITPHSFTAWKRVQKSAPPFALVVEVKTTSPEQQVIDASYRAYKKWLAGRACTPRKPVTFEQWLTAKNIIARENYFIVRLREAYRNLNTCVRPALSSSTSKKWR